MICLDSSRNIIQDTDYIENDLSEKEFLVVDDWDNGEYHFEPYQSDRLVYLGEHDLCYSIYDLEKGLLTRSPYKTRPGMIQSWITTQLTLEIPHLKKFDEKYELLERFNQLGRTKVIVITNDEDVPFILFMRDQEILNHIKVEKG